MCLFDVGKSGNLLLFLWVFIFKVSLLWFLDVIMDENNFFVIGLGFDFEISIIDFCKFWSVVFFVKEKVCRVSLMIGMVVLNVRWVLFIGLIYE